MSDQLLQQLQKLQDEIEKVVIGKTEVIQMTITALLAGGHVLFEDIPGVGKTVMVKTLAKAIQGEFSRVQFTPDLVPSDITGVSIYNAQTRQFEFREGPIFTTILLADEINRTAPRTQAALLEAMSEGHVTIDNHTYPLADNFFVLATQNPIDFQGTYPLPEAQLDRFLFRLQIGYPVFEDELQLIKGRQEKGLAEVQAVLTTQELTSLKEAVEEVHVEELVVKYALELVRATRQLSRVVLGISPRGGIAFVRAAKAYALTQQRTFVTPGDLQKVLPAVFGHRLIFQGGGGNPQQTQEVLEEIMASVPVPIRKKS